MSSSTLNTECIRVGKKADVSLQNIEARRARVAELRMSGLMSSTITKLINAEAERSGWQPVTIRTIERDIAEYFYRVSEDYKIQEGMRLSAIDQMERLVERAYRHIASKDKETWKPGEYMHAISVAQKLQLGLFAVKGWLNRGQAVPQKRSYIQMFDDNAEAVIENRHLLQPVIELLNDCLGEKSEIRN